MAVGLIIGQYRHPPHNIKEANLSSDRMAALFAEEYFPEFNLFMIVPHLEGILTVVVTGAANACAEGFNAMIKKIQARCAGFRNKERFKAAICFHLGGFELYPGAVRK